ncbi:helix-turn-helix domain-containing protein [Sediminivirga luteola]|uniref:PucR C-terminal helix-turn-helix domain-containing protein n=1 Tax=Sediminivirga luteola TaxID=1774748 RepID=A0A8J2TWQ5_9MICO|nr:helix-turn-helix domain-containing protein [Sediminivirga luteola]GGA08621.1 hypothetical protein GCM10011333_09400 [Sediminivirga luteola]
MRELAGKLSALDPEATETLKVIAYFDTLVDGRVSIDGILRGAAVLSGTAVGYQPGERQTTRRYSSDGEALDPKDPGSWPSLSFGAGSTVWLEREGSHHANDAMILERLAIAVSVSTQRFDQHAPARRAVEILVTAGTSADEREEALLRLPFPARSSFRAIAVPVSATGGVLPHAPDAVVVTRFGMARAILASEAPGPGGAQRLSSAPPLSDEYRERVGRAGIGTLARTAGDIPDSWSSALTALRLAGNTSKPVYADELGALLHLAELTHTEANPHPDVIAVGRALASTWWTELLLQAVAQGSSRRGLATLAGVHHSTMEARLSKLPELLGFDPSRPLGQTRLGVALMLHRLTHAQLDSQG